MDDMDWSDFDNINFLKAEILILNFSSDKYVLPPFLVIINNIISPAVLHNFSVFCQFVKTKESLTRENSRP
ncbi:unnamed protein product [Eruca vesicaria subsp. sativa]|uniref:Uncharacterized protein n=1 Tax=Eruca vesicaria subsp. sativa TaxID=29727 RepID=A0ABC8J7X6_ERUVS|nr:unnamed protein product [Eruca vesicaria subsp. sativa]